MAADSGRVERLSFQTDAPEGISAGSIGTDIEFIEVSIGDRAYLLPGHAEAGWHPARRRAAGWHPAPHGQAVLSLA